MIDPSGKCATFVNYFVGGLKGGGITKLYSSFVLLHHLAAVDWMTLFGSFPGLYGHSSRHVDVCIYFMYLDVYMYVFSSVQLHVDYSSYERASMAFKQYISTYLICDKYTDLKSILSTIHLNCSCLNYQIFSPIAYLHLALLSIVLNSVIYKYLTCLRL